MNAYADGAQADKGDDREAYLSHFAFGPEMRTHYSANRRSVAGFAGPCWCRWLVLDSDRANLVEALADARRLVSAIHDRYPELEGAVPIFFSGGKGFQVLLELAHNPPPAVGFHRVARVLAEALAARAGAKIDTAIYDANHIIRLPNTRHPKTGLFKRRIDADALFALVMPAFSTWPSNRRATGCRRRFVGRCLNSKPTGTRANGHRFARSKRGPWFAATSAPRNHGHRATCSTCSASARTKANGIKPCSAVRRG